MTTDYKSKDLEFWEKHLSDETLQICRLRATERPGSGKYDKFYEKGTYYCACCGGDYPLYLSDTKFNSGTGWPSFFQPIDGHVDEHPDPDDIQRNRSVRIEVTCARCDAHLGHVFDDGPAPTGKRYCMNSLALIFVPEGQQPQRTFNEDE